MRTIRLPRLPRLGRRGSLCLLLSCMFLLSYRYSSSTSDRPTRRLDGRPELAVGVRLATIEATIGEMKHHMSILASATARLAVASPQRAASAASVPVVATDGNPDMPRTPPRLPPSAAFSAPAYDDDDDGRPGGSGPQPSRELSIIRSFFASLNAWPVDPDKGKVDSLAAMHGGKALGCSEGTYGEISVDSLLVVLTDEDVNVTAADTFVDVGSGVGKNVLAASYFLKARESTGIEFSEVRWRVACGAVRNYIHGKGGDALAPGAEIYMVRADAMTLDLSGYSVVFMLSTCFRKTFMERLAVQLRRLRVGSRIVSAAYLPVHMLAARLDGGSDGGGGDGGGGDGGGGDGDGGNGGGGDGGGGVKGRTGEAEEDTVIEFRKSLSVKVSWTTYSPIHIYHVVPRSVRSVRSARRSTQRAPRSAAAAAGAAGVANVANVANIAGVRTGGHSEHRQVRPPPPLLTRRPPRSMRGGAAATAANAAAAAAAEAAAAAAAADSYRVVGMEPIVSYIPTDHPARKDRHFTAPRNAEHRCGTTKI